MHPKRQSSASPLSQASRLLSQAVFGSVFPPRHVTMLAEKAIGHLVCIAMIAKALEFLVNRASVVDDVGDPDGALAYDLQTPL